MNPFIVEADLIGGYQNPLFGIVSPTYLAGLDRGECDDMVVKIGKVMGLRFTQEALAYLYDQYGGHPLLTRLACSLMREFAKAEGKPLPLVITDSALKRDASPRDTELRFYCRHIVSELERFYPEEYRLLELLATGAYNEFLDQVRTASHAVHLYKYGALSNPDSPFIAYGVLQDYVAEENARREGRSTPYRVVSLAEREAFVQVRIHSIIEDMRTLESLARQASLPSLFGPNSFPEADRLLVIRAPTDANSLAAALTPLQRSFVESIENYGKSVGSNNYFWSSIKQHYPHLHDALHRVRIYRNEHQHLTLTTGVGVVLKQFLEVDLPGDMIHSPDKFWILLQRTLDELQRALQREIAGLRG